MIKLLLFIFLSATAAGQQWTPAYSTLRVSALAKAIGQAEGFGKKNTLPTRKHNPGDLKTMGKYRVFKTDAEGWAALQAQIVRILVGRSKTFTLDTTINRMGQRYAGGPLWAKNVAKVLGVPGTTTLRQFLCNGDLDVPPLPIQEAQ